MPKHPPFLKIHFRMSEHSLFKFQTFREHDIVFNMYMFEQCIHELLQFRHHQAVSIASVLRNFKIVCYFLDTEISVTFGLMFHVHNPYRICYRATVHRRYADIPFRCIEKFKQVWEQYILFFLQMVFQIFKRNADLFVQLVQFRMSLSMCFLHFFISSKSTGPLFLMPR